LQLIFLSHDVDWRKQGPSLDHVIARKDRFEKSLMEKAVTTNLYYNIPEYMKIEEKFGVRSTFFFRTNYEDGRLEDYHDDIKLLIKGSWEVGLHCDPSSINDIKKIQEEKTKLEKITKTKLEGNRVHFLKFNIDLPKKLQKLGFVYDSTYRSTKDRINSLEMGFTNYDRLIEFPVTIMDAYLFTYMKINENNLISIFKKTLEQSRNHNSDFNIITINWHENVLRMKGGRMYEKILEFLSSQEDVKMFKGIDLVKFIKEKNI